MTVTPTLIPNSVSDRPAVDFIVRDTGCGIEKEKQASLFKPYSQGDATTAGRFGGTGLGLTVSRRLAQALGGDVFLDASLVGSGSTFVARLPTVHSSS